MPQPVDLYETDIIALIDLFDGQAFKSDDAIIVPEYQRDFNWNSELVDRLYLSVLTGLFRDDRQSELTPIFIGSWIVCNVEKQNANNAFPGQEFDLIDGQQRLTTLCIMSFAIILSLTETWEAYRENTTLSVEDVQELDREIEHLCEKLMNMLVGKTTRRDQLISFPRLIRDTDQRDATFDLTYFNSPIAIFVREAHKYYSTGASGNFDISTPLQGNQTGERLVECFELITNCLNQISNNDFYDDGEAEYLPATNLTSAKYLSLLERISSDKQNLVQKCIKDKELENIIRIIFLGRFYLQYIAVSLVKCKSMDAAFDIFDSLNSTGLPLSAIETFKPQVQKQFKSSKFNYTGSPSKIAFENIRGIFDDLRSNQQQEESKRIVTSACYYLTGEKVVEKLFEQRKKLRALQNDFSKVGNMDAVSEALSTIAEWRIIFFSGKPTKKYNIETSVIGLSKSQIDEIKIFCDLLSQAKTVLVIPALARAWDYGKKQKNHVYFYKLLKSLTAYFSIRRYASGQTDGIDTKFRNLIKGGGNTGITGFTIKETKDDDLPTIEEVNNYLKSNLSCKNLRFGPDNKDLWVKTVSQQNIYNASRPLTRFLVMASHTNTIVDQNQGLPTKLNAVESAERNFLTWDNWTSDIYSSIEHVAPQQGIPSEWPGVYDIPSLRNCLGNFVLLPQIQNSQLGNNNWAKKKLYFHMLVQKNKADRTSKLNEAQNAGITFRKTVQNELIDAARSSMLDGVSNTKVWNAKHITSRSLRLSEICWDLFIGWLNEN